jgi:hypothetical protein
MSCCSASWKDQVAHRGTSFGPENVLARAHIGTSASSRRGAAASAALPLGRTHSVRHMADYCRVARANELTGQASRAAARSSSTMSTTSPGMHFRPEFLNRLDDIVLFKPLTQAETERIVDLMLDDLRARLGERQMKLQITDDARRFIARQGYDPLYGAATSSTGRRRPAVPRGGQLVALGAGGEEIAPRGALATSLVWAGSVVASRSRSESGREPLARD